MVMMQVVLLIVGTSMRQFVAHYSLIEQDCCSIKRDVGFVICSLFANGNELAFLGVKGVLVLLHNGPTDFVWR